MPLLPKQEGGSLSEVAAGAHDDTWRAVAALLRKHGRDDASIRIGLEANGDWFPWGIGHLGHNDPAQFVAAYRRVAQVLRVVDRAYVLETGRVAAEGRSAELAADPAIRRSYLGGH